MNNKIQTIIDEIINIDPTLASQRKELEKVIIELVGNRPKIIIDQDFIDNLREKIINKAENKHMKKFKLIYLFAPAAAAVFVLSIIAYNNLAPVTGTPYQISKVSSSAFGSLAISPSERTQAGGGGQVNALSATEDAKMIAPSPIIDPNFPIYKFNYDGPELDPSLFSSEVYRRIKGDKASAVSISTLLKANLGLADLSKVGNMTLESFVLRSNDQYGLNAMVNLYEETIDLGMNWSTWGRNDTYQPLTANQIPSDNEILKVSDNFIAKIGLDKTRYGKGEVDNNWRQWISAVPATEPAYAPDQIMVRYPILVDGQTVYELYGDYYSLNVSVDVKTMRVANVSNLTTQRFEQSEYAIENNSSRILEIAEKGGFNSYYYFSEGGREVQVNLGEPKQILLHHWQTNGDKTDELFIPALSFPITNAPADFYQKQIIVPLVKEVLDSQNGRPEIMPFIKAEPGVPDAAVSTPTVIEPEVKE